jgi:hypothetical protein
VARKLAWEALEAMVSEQRRGVGPELRETEDDEEAARLISALWEWAIARVPAAAQTSGAPSAR